MVRIREGAACRPGRRMQWLLLAFALVVYALGLFVNVTRDGSKYAAVAREMAETGDPIHLTVHGEPYLQKPPLTFWLSALSMKAFGVSDFSFKLPLVLLSLFGLYCLYRLGKSMAGERTGLLAAALLGSSQAFFLYNMDIHTDTVMVPFVTFSLWQLYDFLRFRKTLSCLLGYAGIGFAMLAKGPVGAVVPFFAVCSFLLLTKQYRRFADVRWYAGLIIPLVLILPALKGLYDQFGEEGIAFFFWKNNIGRISGDYTASSRGLLYYVHNLVYLFSPWMVMLFAGLLFSFRRAASLRFTARDSFLSGGIWVFFLLLSFSRGKLPNYILVLLPLFSLLTARLVLTACSGSKERLYRFLLRAQDLVTLLLFALLLVLIVWFFPAVRFLQWLLVAGMILFALFARLGKGGRLQRLLVPSLAAALLLNFFINGHVAPQIFADQAPVRAARIFNQVAAEGERLYNYNYDSHELFFYGREGAGQLRNDVGMFALLKEPGNWILTTEEVVDRMPPDEFPRPDIIPLRHTWINKLGFRYLNPATRPQSYATLYLLRSRAALP